MNSVPTPPATFTRAGTLTDLGGGKWRYTFKALIDATWKGSVGIGLEGYRNATIKGNAGADTVVTERNINPVIYASLDGTKAVARRQVVATEKCNVCHESLGFHGGGSRTNLGEYCVFCHNPATVDVPASVPATYGGPYKVPAQSISFGFMIHRIHTGEELTRDFTVYRTRGVFNFNEILFPGDRQDCATCHVGTSYALPLPATNANTVAPREFYTPLGPAAAACLGCHDAQATAAHASTQTTPFGEACAVCHGTGKELDVAEVHKR